MNKLDILGAQLEEAGYYLQLNRGPKVWQATLWKNQRSTANFQAAPPMATAETAEEAIQAAMAQIKPHPLSGV